MAIDDRLIKECSEFIVIRLQPEWVLYIGPYIHWSLVARGPGLETSHGLPPHGHTTLRLLLRLGLHRFLLEVGGAAVRRRVPDLVPVSGFMAVCVFMGVNLKLMVVRGQSMLVIMVLGTSIAVLVLMRGVVDRHIVVHILHHMRNRHRDMKWHLVLSRLHMMMISIATMMKRLAMVAAMDRSRFMVLVWSLMSVR